MSISRRTATNAAWSVPVIAVAVAAPQSAASLLSSTLVQTHFDVHPDNKAGWLQVKLGYQGAQQGNGYADLATEISVLVDGTLQYIAYPTLIQYGYSGNHDTLVPVPRTGKHLVTYIVASKGVALLTRTVEVESPDWWKYQS